MGTVIFIMALVIIVGLWAIFSCYKRCPPDHILIVYGKTGKNKEYGTNSAHCIHGGAAFVIPIFQSYVLLDLTPISIECNLTNALNLQAIRVDVSSMFTVGISTENENITNMAERLLALSRESIHDLAKDIFFGQLRLLIATMDLEEINSDRDKFLIYVRHNVEMELRKIGLKLIDVNVTYVRRVRVY